MTTAASTPSREPVLEVGHLPEHAFGPDASVWWGNALLVCVEGTMFLLVAATYLYLRGNFDVWPPVAYGDASFRWAAAGVALLLASIPAMLAAKRAAMAEDRRRTLRALAVATALAYAALACRGFELARLPFTWDANAHASVFWTTLGLHTFHEILAPLENTFFLFLLLRGPQEEKVFDDVEANAVYWWFVTAGYLPLFALLYLEPAVLR